jgi:hypothetical protein
MDFSKGFKIQSKEIRPQPVQLPCQSVFFVRPQPVIQRGIAHPAHAHLYDDPGQVADAEPIFQQDAEH